MSKVDELPDLHPYVYQPRYLLETDSKMAKLLVVTDDKNRELVLKIACMQHRSRADGNCQAIRNNIAWLPQLGHCKGISRLVPIAQKGESRLRTWLRAPVYCGKLPHWPGNPDFVVMEYLSGGTLAQFVGNKRLTIEFSLWIAYQVATTLAHLHQHGCVHRDLKPENILFRTSPALATQLNEVKPILIDFGIATGVSEAKLVAGSPLWMAPELQTANEQEPLPADPAWDMYALGLLCCYMLSGLRPRRRQYDYSSQIEYRERAFAMLDSEAEEASESVRNAKTVLKRLLTQTLAQNPAQRPTAAIFAQEAAQLLKTLNTPLPPTVRLVIEVEQRTRLSQRSLRLAGYMLLSIVAFLFLWTTGAFKGLNGPNPAAVAAPNQSANPQINVTPTLPDAPQPIIAPQTEAIVTIVNQDKQVGPPTLAPLPQTGIDPTPKATSVQPQTPLNHTQPPPTLAPARPPLPPPMTAPPLGQIQLTAPTDGQVSSQDRVEFIWGWVGPSLPPEYCYELLFWDPKAVNDKRSPIGVGRDIRKQVSLGTLVNGADPLLKALMHRSNGFHWGVRLVLCHSPQTIVDDIQESRQYTYQD